MININKIVAQLKKRLGRQNESWDIQSKRSNKVKGFKYLKFLILLFYKLVNFDFLNI